ncbi:hypothetical protein RB628_40020 [Streptomyces sp. ADMS]|uniref:hypothetical protein n=1 Tax=Streptomyces sp. ADMS TaxID=3071415 RepID=UPI00297009A7|nr:hypothetical protein [Streptomyces sp. ADMS]MDW4911317.1 hypothetical protein [Streptomyces sp. ADMS]
MDVAQEALDKLSAAGLVFRGVMETRDELPPVNIASFMGNLGTESGRHQFVLTHDEKDLGSRFDQEWELLARDSGLFSAGVDAGLNSWSASTSHRTTPTTGSPSTTASGLVTGDRC